MKWRVVATLVVLLPQTVTRNASADEILVDTRPVVVVATAHRSSLAQRLRASLAASGRTVSAGVANDQAPPLEDAARQLPEGGGYVRIPDDSAVIVICAIGASERRCDEVEQVTDAAVVVLRVVEALRALLDRVQGAPASPATRGVQSDTTRRDGDPSGRQGVEAAQVPADTTRSSAPADETVRPGAEPARVRPAAAPPIARDAPALRLGLSLGHRADPTTSLEAFVGARIPFLSRFAVSIVGRATLAGRGVQGAEGSARVDLFRLGVLVSATAWRPSTWAALELAAGGGVASLYAVGHAAAPYVAKNVLAWLPYAEVAALFRVSPARGLELLLGIAAAWFADAQIEFAGAPRATVSAPWLSADLGVGFLLD